MPDATPPQAGGLWARLFGMGPIDQPQEESKPEEPAPRAAESPPVVGPGLTAAVEVLALPPAPLAELNATAPLPQAVPLFLPSLPPATAEAAAPMVPASGTVAAGEKEVDKLLGEAPSEPSRPKVPDPFSPGLAPSPAEAPLWPAVTALPELCPICQTPRAGAQVYCSDCGWTFSENGPRLFASAPGNATPAAVVPSFTPTHQARSPMTPSAERLKNRYQIREVISERAGIVRYRGLDHGTGAAEPVPVVILSSPLPEMVEVLEEVPLSLPEEDEDILPTFDDVAGAAPGAAPLAEGPAAWPSLGWEKELLARARHPALPSLVDDFIHDNCEFVVVEAPQGQSLWDAWDDPDSEAATRYEWLQQLAEGLQALHQAGAIVEGIRPDLVVVTPTGQARIHDLSDLLPLPLPPQPPLRANLYTAPELILSPQEATAQADLYSFGALIYALEYLHHDLEEKDFQRPYTPFQITERYPDVHPLFFRLVNKTFVRDPHTRFPTDEAGTKDASGFSELSNALDVCRRCFDNVRLDIAAWTTTGMVRTGNEDAFGLLHAVDARQDDLYEYALVLLCDGMGGYEAGEVAAAMAITELRNYLLQQPLFAALAGKDPPPPGYFEVEACKKALHAALLETNKRVYTASRAPGRGRRGMGCTAEAIYLDSRHVVVGHVGDSRTYHLHQGRLLQLTRDQTLVNRLVELGQLTAEEAEHHPRKNELQQAIGGQPEVFPGVYHGKLKRGDWVIVCSDGVTNHIPSADLEKMLTRETAGSAEEAARRLINLCNLRGATDNATLVVIRAS